MSKSALILAGEGYGNIIMATPLMSAISQMGYETHVLVDGNYPDAADLLRGWEELADVHDNMADVQRRIWDVVVGTVWRKGFNGILAERRITPDLCDLRNTHEATANLTCAVQLGWDRPMPETHCECSISSWEPPLVLCPGWGGKNRRQWERKAWPRWAEFATHINHAPLILGGKQDYQPWMQGLPHRLGYEIREVAGILKNTAAVVAIDNGLAHMAAALGTRTIVLFGGTSEVKNRPLGRDVQVVTADIDCRPCQMTEREQTCTDWRCMREITVDMVLEAIG